MESKCESCGQPFVPPGVKKKQPVVSKVCDACYFDHKDQWCMACKQSGHSSRNCKALPSGERR